MKLTINVCSTNTRYNTFLPRILGQLFGQWERLPDQDKKEVEIVALIDNRAMTVGEKRNRMNRTAAGQYVVFVDDDDRVSPDYIALLLKATDAGSDVITFTVSVSLNGTPPKPCYYSTKYAKDYNAPEAYYRLPNHIMCIRRDLAVQVPFKDITVGEDADFAPRIKHLLKTETHLEEALYFYDYSLQTTDAQDYLRKNQPVATGSALCDVIILSNAKTPELELMTKEAIRTLLASEKDGIFNVIVLEQSTAVYDNTKTIYMPGEFNYNRFANLGIALGTAPWVCVANNDLLFSRSWFHQMMLIKHDVMSPKNPGDRRQADIIRNQQGLINARHFSGWCFVMRRLVFDRIGGLDEDFPFWCADNATIEQLKAVSIIPMLVPSSIVKHRASVTLKTLDKKLHDELTANQIRKFNRKYNQNLFNVGK